MNVESPRTGDRIATPADRLNAVIQALAALRSAEEKRDNFKAQFIAAGNEDSQDLNRFYELTLVCTQLQREVVTCVKRLDDDSTLTYLLTMLRAKAPAPA